MDSLILAALVPAAGAWAVVTLLVLGSSLGTARRALRELAVEPESPPPT